MGLNSILLKSHVHPELQNMTLFGNRIFADVIIYDEIILD